MNDIIGTPLTIEEEFKKRYPFKQPSRFRKIVNRIVGGAALIAWWLFAAVAFGSSPFRFESFLLFDVLPAMGLLMLIGLFAGFLWTRYDRTSFARRRKYARIVRRANL
jgi:hypothetical protein